MMTTDSQTSEDWIAIARILRPQGRRGEVLAELLTDQVAEFRAGREVRLETNEGPRTEPVLRVLEEHWLPVGKNAGRIVLKLQECDSISDAEALARMNVSIPAAELPALEADTFYVKDLLGCTLLDGERVVGQVVDVQFATSPDGRARLEDAAPLLCVDPDGNEGGDEAKWLLIPLVRAYLENVDVAGQRIQMNLPAGLIDSELQAEPEPGGEG